jgi:diguanylate cyclase (GGDEF)-like protein
VDPVEGLTEDAATPRPDRRVAVRGAAGGAEGADEALIAALTSAGGLAAFVAEVGRVLDVWLVDIWAFDREREAAVYEAVWRRDGASAAELGAVGSRVALDERPDLRLLLERRALVERHIDDPDLSRDLSAQMKRRGYRSCFDAPLLDGADVVGVLGLVERRAVRRLTDAERGQLERVCRLAALGVQTAWARRLSDEHAEHLLALTESGHALAATLDRRATLACFSAAVARLLPGVEHEVDIWLREENGSFVRGASDAEWLPRVDGGGEPPDPLVLRAIARHRPAQARTGGEPTRLIVPLVVGGEAAGYIDIHGRPLRRFTPDEVAVLQVLGDHAAVALEYARLGRSLDRQTAVDTVTGFFNRWYFYERLYSETARAERYKQPLSILLVGIDGYEKFAIRRGQADGDAVLKAIARLLTASLRRKVDVACVHGVGEFGLLLPNTPPFKPGAALVGQRLRTAIDGMELRNEDHELLGKFTLSVGIAGFPRHADDADELGGYAGEALAQARALGGNRLQVYGAAPDAFQGEPDEGEPPAGGSSSDDSLSALILPPDWDD